MSAKKAEILLAAVISARSTSFIFNKILMTEMSSFNLLALRCLTAAVLLMIVFSKHLRSIKKKELTGGVIVGALYFLVMWTELSATRITSTSTVALVQNTAIVIVLILESLLIKKMPDRSSVICAFLAMAGVIFISAEQGEISEGMLISLLSAVIYALAILATTRVSRGDTDPLNIGMIQVGTMGVLAMISVLLSGGPVLPSGGNHWFMLIYLILVCTGFGFTLQPMAQSRLSASRAGIFCALGPAVATVLGVVFMHEKFSILGFIGICMIMSSIILPYIRGAEDQEV